MTAHDERLWRVLEVFAEMGEASPYDVYKHEETDDPMNITLPMQTAYRTARSLENMGLVEVTRHDASSGRSWFSVTPLGRFALERRATA